jgi:SH3 domain protein
MITRALLAIALCGLFVPAAADVAYVTDILRLGIHEASDTSDRPFDNLVSGAELQVLERTTNFARVRTAAGRVGWVKSAFLVTEEPAQARVAQLEAELAALRDEVAAARVARQSAEEQAERLGRERAAATGSAEAIQDTLARLQRDNETYENRLEAYRGSLPLPWVGAALVVALTGGFVAGLWWLDALIRRRHGGFRIY